MALQRLDDLVDVDLRLVVLGLHGGHVVALLLEEAEEALGLLLVRIEAAQLGHQVCDGVADLVQILGLDVLERRVGELGDVLLGSCAVGEHEVGVGDVDLLGEGVDHLLLLLGELLHVHSVGLHLLDDGLRLGDGLLGCGNGGRRLGRGNGGIQRELDFIHVKFPPANVVVSCRAAQRPVRQPPG